MSAVTVAELLVAFRGDTTGFDKANLSVRQNLVKTAVTAEETAEAFLHLASGIGTSGAAYEAASVQAATYTRVALDSAKASEAAATAFVVASREAGTVEAALTLAVASARSASTEFVKTGGSATRMKVEMAALKSEVMGLNRTLNAQASMSIATKLDAGATAASAMEARVAALTAQMAALNAELAATKATGFPSVPTGGRGGAAGTPGGNFAGKAIGAGNSVGRSLTNYVTTPILLADAASLKFAGDFDTAMRNVNSLAKLSESGFRDLEKSVLGLVDDPRIRQMPSDLAEGLYDVQGRGFKGAEAMDVLRQSAIGASAGMTTTLTSAAALGAVLNSHVKGVKDSKEAMDVLFTEVDLGANSFEALATSLGPVLPTAAAAGVSLQELMAGFVVMTNQGNSAAEAATSYNNMMTHIIKPSKDAAEVMHALGIEYGINALQSKGLAGWLKEVSEKTGGNKQALIQLMPELRGMKGLLATVNDGGKAYAIALEGTKRASEGAGAAAKANAEQQKSLGFETDKMKQEAARAAIALGNELVPAARDVIGVVRDATRWFNSLDAQTRSNIVRWGLYAAAMGPVVKVGTTFANGIRAVMGLRTAYVASQTAMAAANVATATSATTATAAVGGLATSIGGIVALAAAPIVVTFLMKKIGDDFEDSVAQARADNAKGYDKLQFEARKKARAFYNAHGEKETMAYAGTNPGGRYIGFDVATAKEAIASEKRMAMDRQYRDSVLNSHAKAEAEKAKNAHAAAARQAQQDQEASRRAAGILAGLGADKERKGRKAKETDPLDQYREQQYQLKKSLALGPDAPESASMAYDIAKRHLDGLSGMKGAAGKSGADLGAEIVKHAGDAIKTPAGQASCAYFASAVMKAAGAKVPGSASAKGLRDSMVASGAVPHPASEAKAGDVIIWKGRRYGAIKDADGQGYHAGIAMGDGTVRASSGGRVRTMPIYDAAHATAYTLPGAGGASDSSIVAAARRNLALQLAVERGEKALKAREDAADKAKDRAKEVADLMQAAKRAANEASRAVLATKLGTDEDTLSLAAYGVPFADIPKVLGKAGKAIQSAIAQQAKAVKDQRAAEVDPRDAGFDDGSDMARDLRSKRAEKALEASRRSIEEFEGIMRSNADKRDEGGATSLAARRTHYVKEQVGGLKTTGDFGLDLERQRQVAKAAGEAFDATPIRAYRSAMRDLSRQLGELGPQTDAARIAAIRFDSDGLERMDEDSAKAILALEKLTDKMRAQKETARQAGDALGQAFTGAMTDGLNHGFMGFLRALVSNVDQAIRQAVLAKFASGISNLVAGVLGPKGPGVKDPGMTGSGGSLAALAGALPAFLPHFAKGGPVGAGEAVVVGDGGNGSGTEVFVPRVAGNILPNEFVQGVTNMANNRNESKGGDTHNTFNHSPTIQVSGPVDRRSLQQIKTASYEGARQAWEAAR